MEIAEEVREGEFEIVDPPNKSERGIHKRTWDQREEDLLITARMIFENKSHREIAEHISNIRPYKISRRQISQDVKALDKHFRGTHLHSLPTLKARELQFLTWLQQEAYDAWAKSKQDFESVKQVGIIGKDGKPTGAIEVTKLREGSAGNPAFLAILTRVSEARARITGIFAPVKIDAELSSPEDNQNLEHLRKAYRDRIAVDVAKKLKLISEGKEVLT